MKAPNHLSIRFVSRLWNERVLLAQLIQREVSGRYRGSILGWGWTVANPLMMLAVYTFVFSTVFKARWPDLQQAGPIGFAINLFAGLIVFNLFSECVGKAPTLILAQPNYVKKIIFPLDLLSAVAVAAAGFHALTSLAVLGLFMSFTTGAPHISALWLPVVWLPLVLGCLGVCWLLSALGVYLRDLAQVINLSITVLMFMSAVFYPLSALPDRWQPVLSLNPLVSVIEQTRKVLLSGQAPSPQYITTILWTFIFAEFSFRMFQRARRGFADVM